MSLVRFTVVMSVSMMLAGLWAEMRWPTTAPPGTEKATRFAHPAGRRSRPIATCSTTIFTIFTRPDRRVIPVRRTTSRGLQAGAYRVMPANRRAMIIRPPRLTDPVVPILARRSRREMIAIRLLRPTA